MIKIDVNLSLLASMFDISPQRLKSYGNKSIEQILEAEAAQGNTKAANFDKEILNDPIKIVEFFKLNDVRNRYAIMKEMRTGELDDMLELLDKKDLVNGLNYFNKDKLLQLAEKIPKDQLVKVVFQMFSPEQVMKLFPEQQLNKFLSSPNLDKGLVMKNLKSLPVEVLAQMLETTTGKPIQSDNKQDLLKQIEQLNPQKYKDALKSLPLERKRQFILQMAKEEPKLFQIFDAEAYTKILARKDKPDIVKSMEVIEKDELIKMVQQLPKDLLSAVVTQIDPQVLAQLLMSQYKEILSQIGSG